MLTVIHGLRAVADFRWRAARPLSTQRGSRSWNCRGARPVTAVVDPTAAPGPVPPRRRPQARRSQPAPRSRLHAARDLDGLQPVADLVQLAVDEVRSPANLLGRQLKGDEQLANL